MSIGLYLKTYRAQQHLTQKEMAHKLGISRVHLSRLERHKELPSAKLFDKICFSTQYLWERLNRRKKDGSPPELVLMCEMCNLLKEQDRKNVFHLMQKLSQTNGLIV